MSHERMLATGQTGAAAYPLPVVRFTAVRELAAAVGLIVPSVVGSAPEPGGWAAVGLAGVIGAMTMPARLAVTQHRASEWRSVAVNVLILLVCLFVAAGRR